MYYKVTLVSVEYQVVGMELEGEDDTPEEAIRLALLNEGEWLDSVPEMSCVKLTGMAYDGEKEYSVELVGWVEDEHGNIVYG